MTILLFVCSNTVLLFGVLSILDADHALFGLNFSNTPLSFSQLARTTNMGTTARTGKARDGYNSNLMRARIFENVHVKILRLSIAEFIGLGNGH